MVFNLSALLITMYLTDVIIQKHAICDVHLEVKLIRCIK